jgi:ABC-type Na+ efflux pump permease subunit
VPYHSFLIGVFLLAIAGIVVVLTASSLTGEKESGCLPLLLTTPLTDGEILAAKAQAALRCCVLPASMLALHLAAFTLLQVLTLIGTLCVLLIVAQTAAFLTGLGLYCSARCRRTRTSLLIAIGTAVAWWWILPWLASPCSGSFARAGGLVSMLGWAMHCASPFVQLAAVCRQGVAGGMAVDRHGDAAWWQVDGTVVAAWTAFHLIVGIILAWRAKRQMRRNVF